MAAIVTEALTKYYGPTPGIVDLDIEVQVGEVFGFLGPNGAGKSTTIRTLLHMLHPTSGTGSILGLDIGKDSVEIRKRIGYIPGDLAMYNDMTAQQLFEYLLRCAMRTPGSWSKSWRAGSARRHEEDRLVLLGEPPEGGNRPGVHGGARAPHP